MLCWISLALFKCTGHYCYVFHCAYCLFLSFLFHQNNWSCFTSLLYPRNGCISWWSTAFTVATKFSMKTALCLTNMFCFQLTFHRKTRSPLYASMTQHDHPACSTSNQNALNDFDKLLLISVFQPTPTLIINFQNTSVSCATPYLVKRPVSLWLNKHNWVLLSCIVHSVMGRSFAITDLYW